MTDFNEQYKDLIPKPIFDKIHEKDCSIKEVFNMALDSCIRIEGYRRNGLWKRYGDVLFEKDPVELINNICA